MASNAGDKMHGMECILELVVSFLSSMRYFVARYVFTGDEWTAGPLELSRQQFVRTT